MSSMALEAGAVPPPSGLPPTVNLDPRDVESLAEALLAYRAEFVHALGRSSPGALRLRQ